MNDGNPWNPWDEDRIRLSCVEGTYKQYQAYINAGYIPKGPPPPQTVLKPNPFKNPKAPEPKVKQLKTIPIEPPIISREQYAQVIENLDKADTMERILRCVAAKHGLQPREIKGRSRRKEIVLAKREVCYLCSTRLGRSTPAIGNMLGIDHTSVMYHLRMAAQCENKDFTSPGRLRSIRSGVYFEGVKYYLPKDAIGWRRRRKS